MALNTAALIAAADGFKAAFPYLSLHTTGAVTSSANESAAARVAAAWVNTNGVLTSTKPFTGGAASGPVARAGYWSAPTGGTYGGGSLVSSGDAAFNAAGAYTASVTETPTSS